MGNGGMDGEWHGTEQALHWHGVYGTRTQGEVQAFSKVAAISHLVNSMCQVGSSTTRCYLTFPSPLPVPVFPSRPVPVPEAPEGSDARLDASHRRPAGLPVPQRARRPRPRPRRGPSAEGGAEMKAPATLEWWWGVEGGGEWWQWGVLPSITEHSPLPFHHRLLLLLLDEWVGFLSGLLRDQTFKMPL